MHRQAGGLGGVTLTGVTLTGGETILLVGLTAANITAADSHFA